MCGLVYPPPTIQWGRRAPTCADVDGHRHTTGKVQSADLADDGSEWSARGSSFKGWSHGRSAGWSAGRSLFFFLVAAVVFGQSVVLREVGLERFGAILCILTAFLGRGEGF